MTDVRCRNSRGARPGINALPREGKTKAPPSLTAPLHAAEPRSCASLPRRKRGSASAHGLPRGLPRRSEVEWRSPRGVVLELDHQRDLGGGQVVRVARLVRVDDTVAALE